MAAAVGRCCSIKVADGPAAKCLQPQGPGAGKQIDRVLAANGGGEDVENRLADAVFHGPGSEYRRYTRFFGREIARQSRASRPAAPGAGLRRVLAAVVRGFVFACCHAIVVGPFAGTPRLWYFMNDGADSPRRDQSVSISIVFHCFRGIEIVPNYVRSLLVLVFLFTAAPLLLAAEQPPAAAKESKQSKEKADGSRPRPPRPRRARSWSSSVAS